MQEDVTRLLSAPVLLNTDSLELLCTGSYNHMNDTTGVFRRTNPQLPSNPMLHTFLLDENNEVLVVGTPLVNEKIDRMFWRTVKEKLGTGQKEKANDLCSTRIKFSFSSEKTVILFAYKEILFIFATIKQNKKPNRQCS